METESMTSSDGTLRGVPAYPATVAFFATPKRSVQFDYRMDGDKAVDVALVGTGVPAELAEVPALLRRIADALEAFSVEGNLPSNSDRP